MRLLPLLPVLLLGWSIACAPSRPEPPDISLELLDQALAHTIMAATDAVRKAPASAVAWGKLGQAYEAAEFDPQALECYERAVSLDPQSPRWLHLLGLRQMRNDPEAGMQNLARAADLSAQEAPRLRLAQALAEHGRADEAVRHLQVLLAEHPSHPAARLALARLRLAAHDFQSVPNLLQPCLTNAFTRREAHLLMSQALQRSGEPAQAAEFARRARSLPAGFDWPDPFLREVQELWFDPQTLTDRANALMMQGQFDAAEAALDRLRASAPSDGESTLLLGRLRIQQRRCAEAIEILAGHLAERPESLQGWVQLGLARFCEQHWTEAAEAFRRATVLKPDFAQAHYNLGLALARSGRSTEAMARFRDALRCQPGDAASHAALAEELHRAGSPEEARAEIEAALRIDPRQPKALALRQALPPAGPPAQR